MTPVEGIYLRSRVIHGDLVSADSKLTEQPELSGEWFPFLKLALIALGNLADLEGVMKSIYQANPKLSSLMNGMGKNLLFAKYLRNVFGGHLNEALFAKAYEWRPELRHLTTVRDLGGTILLNVFILETAINTYVEPDGTHGIFPSETDLIYPPDLERFCEWLSTTVRLAIEVCDWLGDATHSKVCPLNGEIDMFEAFKAAGLTDFTRIKKLRP